MQVTRDTVSDYYVDHGYSLPQPVGRIPNMDQYPLVPIPQTPREPSLQSPAYMEKWQSVTPFRRDATMRLLDGLRSADGR